MRTIEIHKMLGKSSKTLQRQEDLVEKTWIRSKTTWVRNRENGKEVQFKELWPKGKTLLEHEATDKIKIIYKNGKVIQIEVTSPRFKTRSGISPQSEFEDIAQKFHVRRGEFLIGSVYSGSESRVLS